MKNFKSAVALFAAIGTIAFSGASAAELSFLQAKSLCKVVAAESLVPTPSSLRVGSSAERASGSMAWYKIRVKLDDGSWKKASCAVDRDAGSASVEYLEK